MRSWRQSGVKPLLPCNTIARVSGDRLSFNTACELGFRGSLDEWERLMGQLRGGERAV